jgi:phosphoribulokinase
VIRFAQPGTQELEGLRDNLAHAFISRHDTIVVPGAAMAQAMSLILTPRMLRLLAER